MKNDWKDYGGGIKAKTPLKDLYDESNYDERGVRKLSKTSKSMTEFGNFLMTGIRGIADWFGLGDTVASWFDKSSGTTNMAKMRNDFSARIQKILTSGDYDLQALEDKVAQLSDLGLVISGKARDMLTQRIRERKQQVRNAKATNLAKQVKTTSIQTDIDRLKNFQESNDLKTVQEAPDLAQKIEQELGDLENGKF